MTFSNIIYQPHQERKIPVPARKPVKKKAKDKPKRPLSAYNYFFKEDRARLVAIVQNEDNATELREKNPDITDEVVSKLLKKDGKISFEEMGKIIGKRWKDIAKEKKERYNNLASHDTDRYKAEMHKYNEKQEEIRVKNKRSAELQFAQMAATQAQQASIITPSMIKYSEAHTSQPGMYPAQMGYPVPPYSNAPYGYQHPHMGMMGAYNPYYMSMQPNNMDRNLPANGDLPDTETSANQDTAINSYPPPFPPTQINHQNSYLQNYLHQQQPNEYYQLDSMPKNGNELSFNSQQQEQGQEQATTSQNLEPDSSISSTYPPQEQHQLYNGVKQQEQRQEQATISQKLYPDSSILSTCAQHQQSYNGSEQQEQGQEQEKLSQNLEPESSIPSKYPQQEQQQSCNGGNSDLINALYNIFTDANPKKERC